MKFNETKSQERLINLMLQAGVEWPDKAKYAMQSGCKGNILFSSVRPKPCNPEGSIRGWNFTMAGPVTSINQKPLPNWHQTIITREQYEARDGWIVWDDGYLPVDGEQLIDVLTVTGEVHERNIAKMWCWSKYCFAYRPSKPSQPKPYDKEKVSLTLVGEEISGLSDGGDASIPTIEQLIAEWKWAMQHQEAKLHNLNKQQAVYDSARAITNELHKRVQDKLAELGWSADAQLVPDQPIITDWRNLRVGDVIEPTSDWEGRRISGRQLSVNSLDFKDELKPIRVVHDDNVATWGCDFKFIRRP